MSTAKDHLARIQRRPALNGLDPNNKAYAIFDRDVDQQDGAVGYGLLLIRVINRREAANTITFQQSSDNNQTGDAYANVSVLQSDLSTSAATFALPALAEAEFVVSKDTERYLKVSVENDEEADLEVRVIHHIGTIDLVNRILNES